MGLRLIAATHLDLTALASAGGYRRDLLERLSSTAIAIPALRERGQDIFLLAEHFLAAAGRDTDRQGAAFSAEARELLERYPWPGNVAQLRAVIEQVALAARGRQVRASDLPGWLRGSEGTAGTTRTLAQVEAEYVRDVLASVKSNKSRAAQILGISRKTLREKLKQAGDHDSSA
jgi:DNA-binding NtrC family response regulator